MASYGVMKYQYQYLAGNINNERKKENLSLTI